MSEPQSPQSASSPRRHANISDESNSTKATSVSNESIPAERSERTWEGLIEYVPTQPDHPFAGAWDSSLSEQIQPLVEAQGDWFALGVRSLTYDATDPGATVRTVVVTHRNRKHAGWKHVRRAIRAILVREGWGDIDVDVRRGGDSRFGRSIQYFPTHPDDPFVAAWESLYPRILSLVSSKTGWSTIGVRNIVWGNDDPQSPPVRTVCISICGPRARLFEWDEVESAIQHMLSQAGWRDIDVDVARGGAFHAGSPDQYVKHIGLNVKVDAGIERNSGMIGGWLALESGAGQARTVDIMGLTCHHVLFDAKNPTGIYKHGLMPNQAVQLPPLHHPSDHVHDKKLRENTVGISMYTKAIEQCQERLDMGMERAADGIKGRTEQREVCQAILTKIQPFDRTLGHPWASSGYRLSPATRATIDWGLVKIQRGRTGRNAYGPADLNQLITEMSRLTLGDAVTLMHKGNQVSGVIDAIRDGIILPNNPGPAREHVLVCKHGEKPYPIKPGFSGAVILNSESTALVGMIIAGEAASGAAYVTPIDVIIDDIESRTGCKVRMPVAEDYPEWDYKEL